ncbi:hypothetical protein, partial [Escherichia coli]|uniref:hypothetical protein n=1 Tax=Escherichia coli TaxID=562 RepID=UPI001BE45311
GDNNATPRTATATSSTPANPPGTEIKTLTSTTVANVDKDAVVTVTVASQTTGSSGASAPASAPPAITTTPFVVTLASTPGPTAPVIGTVTNDVSSPVIDNGFSSHATLTITGTAEAGSTVTVYD